MPGWTLHVLERDRDEIAPSGAPGRIVVDRPASPLAWFDGYHGARGPTARTIQRGRPLVLHRRHRPVMDDDGDFHFTSRDDDIIIMAGYRIGPFEVESVLASIRR